MAPGDCRTGGMERISLTDSNDLQVEEWSDGQRREFMVPTGPSMIQTSRSLANHMFSIALSYVRYMYHTIEITHVDGCSHCYADLKKAATCTQHHLIIPLLMVMDFTRNSMKL